MSTNKALQQKEDEHHNLFHSVFNLYNNIL